MISLPTEPTPEMIAAGADALEYVRDIGRWEAEALAKSVLERALDAHHQPTPASGGDGSDSVAIIHCGGAVFLPSGHHGGFGPRHS